MLNPIKMDSGVGRAYRSCYIKLMNCHSVRNDIENIIRTTGRLRACLKIQPDLTIGIGLHI